MIKIRKYLYFLGIFFFMFPPYLMIYGYTIKTVYLFVFGPSLIGGYNYFTKRKASIVEKDTLKFMLLTFVLFFIFSGINFFQDISVIKAILTGFVVFFACSFYVDYYIKTYKDRFVTHLFMDLNKAGIIQSVIVIATFLSPDFKEFLYSFIGLSETSTRYLFETVSVRRFQGIVASGFSFLSTTHALLLVTGVWGFYINDKKYRLFGIILFWLGQVTIFFSIVLIGRTGFVVILIFLCTLVILRVHSFVKAFRLSKKTVKSLFVFFVISITVLNIIDFSKYSANINFAFETLINFRDSRELDSSTTEVLKNHLIFPKTSFELLFGTGNFGRSENLPYIPSDIGYALFISGAGIFGMMIGYSFYFVGLYYSYKYRNFDPYLSSFIATFFIALIILNMKDYYFISLVGYSQIYFILICVLGKFIDNQKSIIKYKF